MKFKYDNLRSAAIWGMGYGFGSKSLELGLISFVAYFILSTIMDMALKS